MNDQDGLRLVFASTPDNLSPLRDRAREVIERAGYSEKATGGILVALGEAFTNAIRHSYHNEPNHEIHVTIEDLPDRIVIRIRDFGEKIDLKAVKEPTLPPIESGGLGLYFMKTIMDGVEYNTAHPEGNELILTKKKESK